MIRRVNVILVGAVVLLLTAACGLIPGAGEDEKTDSSAKPTKSKPAPTRPPKPENAVEATPEAGQDDLTATVDSFVADETGFGRLTYTLTNVGDEQVGMSAEFGTGSAEGNHCVSTQVGNIHIIDEQAEEEKYVLVDSYRGCLAYWVGPGSAYFYLEPDGDSATFSNNYLVNDETRTVTVLIPGFEPVKGVEVERR